MAEARNEPGLKGEISTTDNSLKVVPLAIRIQQRQEKLDACAKVLIPHVEGILNDAILKNSHRGHIFHVCSFQEQVKKILPDYNLDVDGTLDILKKYYNEGFAVSLSDCNKGNKACCWKASCAGHVEITLVKS